VQDELPWVEGSEEEATKHSMGGIVQQKKVRPHRAKDKPFRIPEDLGERDRSLLDTTSDDFARGTVKELKCRLCPDTGFSRWEYFRRHCESGEAHPLEISFCRFCGDFFAREDTLKRHEKDRPPQCFDVTLDEAEVKRMETRKAHDAFQEKFKKCLESSGEAWTPFSQIIGAMYPESSKRGSRQQCRLKDPEA
jgi:hypothetical protein